MWACCKGLNAKTINAFTKRNTLKVKRCNLIFNIIQTWVLGRRTVTEQSTKQLGHSWFAYDFSIGITIIERPVARQGTEGGEIASKREIIFGGRGKHTQMVGTQGAR